MTAGAGGRPPTRPGRPLRVIFNAAAGSKPGLPAASTTADDVRALLEQVGLEADVVASSSQLEARRIARAAVEAGDEIVVAGGGDGTIGAVAEALIGSSTALGILPLGSVMNIPRMLGLPRDPAAAARILVEGAIHAVDVGEVAGRPFFESGSVGLNAAMFREAQRWETGDRASPVRTLWVAVRYRPARMRIELDDHSVATRALMVTVSNGPYTGAGMTVAPDARLDDGRFDVRIFERFSKWELLRHLASIAFGRRVYAPRVSTHRSAAVRISSAHPLPARADSRDLGSTPVRFRVVPGALLVVGPAAGLPVGAARD